MVTRARRCEQVVLDLDRVVRAEVGRDSKKLGKLKAGQTIEVPPPAHARAGSRRSGNLWSHRVGGRRRKGAGAYIERARAGRGIRRWLSGDTTALAP